MRSKLIVDGLAALRRLLLGQDTEYRIEWVSSPAHDQQQTPPATTEQQGSIDRATES